MKKTSLIVAAATAIFALLTLSAMPEAGELSYVRSQTSADRSLVFIENMGQWSDVVRFRTDCEGATVWLTGNGVFYSFSRYLNPDQVTPRPEELLAGVRPSSSHGQLQILNVKVNFIDGNDSPTVSATELSQHRFNYLYGNDPTGWNTDVPGYESVIIEEIYPGISTRFYGYGGRLEYDLIVSPGADPSVIGLRYDGVEFLELGDAGELIVLTDWGEIIEAPPVVYQQVGNIRKSIPASFELKAGNSFGIRLDGAYQRGLPLVIDPVLEFSTYLGGGDIDAGFGVAVDDNDNIYVAGVTASIDFPGTAAFQGTHAGAIWDAFVTKYSANGEAVIYSTYLGGTSDDYAYAVAVDQSGSAYVTGRTESSDFPTVNPIYPANLAGDAFVVKLSSDGSIMEYGTYLGGSSWDVGWDIAVDGNGAAFVTGYTDSDDFPTFSPLQDTLGGGLDLFVTRINATGSALEYSTYLGGEGTDVSQAICLDGTGRAYLTGFTSSNLFPTVNPYQENLMAEERPDLFISRLSADGVILEYSTYLGGYMTDIGYDIAVGDDSSMYVTGRTFSNSYPTVNPIQSSLNGESDLLITKLNAAGDALVYSTFLGGGENELPGGIAVDADGRLFVTGSTASDDFPRLTAFQVTYGGGDFDGLITLINAAGDGLVYSSFIGGSDRDEVNDIALGIQVQACLVGQTVSGDFPTILPLQVSSGGNTDAFVAMITCGCLDTDKDSICDSIDNCVYDFNPLQEDSDLDEVGDSCDVCPFDPDNDEDGDGVCGDEDNCPSVYNPYQEDPDLDGLGDSCDNCPANFNPNQVDADNDNLGDSCDICPLDYFNDIDGDGICGDVDNCPGIYNPDQLDADSNGIGDVCEDCCVDLTGNVDCDLTEMVDISDLTELIDHLFIQYPPLCCPGEANTDGSIDGVADISDLTVLIDHLFITYSPLPPCL